MYEYTVVYSLQEEFHLVGIFNTTGNPGFKLYLLAIHMQWYVKKPQLVM